MNASMCSQAGCLNTDLKCYKMALRQKFTLMCEPCATRLIDMGYGFTAVERRIADVPVLTERRRTFRPRWLARLIGRDETGRLAA